MIWLLYKVSYINQKCAFKVAVKMRNFLVTWTFQILTILTLAILKRFIHLRFHGKTSTKNWCQPCSKIAEFFNYIDKPNLDCYDLSYQSIIHLRFDEKKCAWNWFQPCSKNADFFHYMDKPNLDCYDLSYQRIIHLRFDEKKCA